MCKELMRGRSVAIYMKNKFQENVLLSKSVIKLAEILVLELSVKTTCIHVIGCYRTPSADYGALSSLIQFLTLLNSKEFVVLGDFNSNWLHSVSDDLKAYYDSLNLFQIVNGSTFPNSKCSENSSLIDLIFTNVPYCQTWTLKRTQMQKDDR